MPHNPVDGVLISYLIRPCPERVTKGIEAQTLPLQAKVIQELAKLLANRISRCEPTTLAKTSITRRQSSSHLGPISPESTFCC